MKNIRGRVALLLTLLPGCPPHAGDLDKKERKTIDHWLGCTDCSGDALDSVVALAARKPSATVETLGTDLLAGPSAVRRQNLRLSLQLGFTQDSVFRVNHPADTLVPGSPKSPPIATLVDLYAFNGIVTYKERAGVALGKIAGTRACTAIDSAQKNRFRVPYDTVPPEVRSTFIKLYKSSRC